MRLSDPLYPTREWILKKITDSHLELSNIDHHGESEDGEPLQMEHWSIFILPGLIVMYGNHGLQNYRADVEHIRDIPKLFPDKASIFQRSLLETQGETSPREFLKSIIPLHKAGRLTTEQKQELENFIFNCDCPPNVIKEKLFQMGYGSILPDVTYAVPTQKLLALTYVMEILVRIISLHYSA